MKKTKRVLALLLCLVLILSAVGCSAKKDDGKRAVTARLSPLLTITAIP